MGANSDAKAAIEPVTIVPTEETPAAVTCQCRCPCATAEEANGKKKTSKKSKAKSRAKSKKSKGKKKKSKKDESDDSDSASDSASASESESENEEDADEDADGEEEESGEKKVLAPIGSVSEIKNIYRSPKDDDGNWTWVDKYPEDVEDAAENEETETFAVLVRNVKSNDSRKKLEAHSIVVQSPWLKKALGEILDEYPGVACELKRLEFEAPFQPFLHRWTDLVKYREREDLDDKTKEHLTLLHDILKYEIGDNIKSFEDYVRNGVVSFKHLWMVLQPGKPVVSAFRGPLTAFELAETEYMSNNCGNFLRLRCDCVDYGGKNFGRYQEKIDIPEFIGTKKITGLNVYPLAFHPERDSLVEKLIKRGKVFESLAGHHYKSYNGKAITWDREGNEVAIQVDGRIIVDIDSFNRYSPYRTRYLNDWNAKDLERLGKHKDEHGVNDEGQLRLTPYHHMLARSRTRGYSLKLKKWLDFYIEDIAEITWNTNAFDKLVLPDDQKELILAFSESQLEGSSFDDVISGKGKGIICLLSGPPGVGKTLTAEAVAENLRVPLHTLSSGDLGSGPWEVERELQSILELVSRWNAILLLDECDVFLEARATHDLERNKVVSIFLRTLEYYEGIMFMTTNRVDNIDAAFQSRIHVSLEYPDLTSSSRRAIWKNFLRGATIKSGITDAEIEQLSELKLNGRQIKNILKTAQLLAARRKSATLEKKFIDTVLAIEKRRPGAPSNLTHYI
ncbi:P-loop containing nucleoside triphosphate hydrolase protein [Cercophora newfieldiana]|uniref:P-loop containing nucleoside triphosphate hydrolase protein n=1 Tax=Cercophora newfieldiana TaxID=92897 RepID=A0AA40CYE9_9PEZI|nr:P-loop containing nucleoside triphosphate hydrolase protein [Cercophora newfieldiana]